MGLGGPWYRGDRDLTGGVPSLAWRNATGVDSRGRVLHGSLRHCFRRSVASAVLLPRGSRGSRRTHANGLVDPDALGGALRLGMACRQETRSRGTGMSRAAFLRLAGCAIAVSLFLWWLLADSSYGDEQGAGTRITTDILVSPSPDAGAPRRQREETLVRRPTSSTRSLRVLHHDGRTVDAGSLFVLAESQDLGSDEREVRVADGHASMPEAWIGIDECEPSDWIFRFDDGTPAQVRESSLLERGGFELRLWPVRRANIRVVDLAGQPISGSRVRVLDRNLGWIEFGDARDDGLFNIAWYGPSATVVADASAPGHVRRRTLATDSHPEPSQVELPALLYLALLAPEWPNVAVAIGVDAGMLSDSSDASSLALMRARSEASVPPLQRPSLRLYVWEEASLAARESEVEVFVVDRLDSRRQIKVSFKPQLLGDAEMAVHVLDYSELIAVEPCRPFEVVVDQLSAWTKEELPFIEILLRDTEPSFSGREWFSRVHATGKGRFAGVAPAGRYEIHGLPHERRWQLGDDLRIQGGATLSISTTEVASANLELEPSETYAEVHFETLLGCAPASGILLTPSDGRTRRVIPPLEYAPLHRPLRPGVYDAWYYDYEAHETRRLMSGLVWDGPTSNRSEWRIVIPPGVLGALPDAALVPRTP